jgi:hypothetical protein
MSPGRESAADLEAKVLEAVLAQAVSASRVFVFSAWRVFRINIQSQRAENV